MRPRSGLIHAGYVAPRWGNPDLDVDLALDVDLDRDADVSFGPVRPLPAGWSSIYRVVRRIPRGRVATYGDVALAAGKARGARQVGYALAALRGAKHDVPWQRVLGARPRGFAAISILDPMGAAVQRSLLEKEGIRFDERGRVELARFGWRKGRVAPRRASATPARTRRRA